MELGKGEALVSFLEGNGTPSVVERAMIRPPSARLGPITPAERKAVMDKSPVKGKYDQTVDPISAYEILNKRVDEHVLPVPGEAGQTPAPAPDAPVQTSWLDKVGIIVGTIFGTNRKRGQRLSTGQVIARNVTRTVVTRTAGSVAAQVGKSIGGSMGQTIGREIVRNTLGGVLRR
jgi:DNA helicase HerA-like ATPase